MKTENKGKLRFSMLSKHIELSIERICVTLYLVFLFPWILNLSRFDKLFSSSDFVQSTLPVHISARPITIHLQCRQSSSWDIL